MAASNELQKDYEVKYGNHIYSLHYSGGRTMRFNSGGKYFPVVTQCIFKIDGIVKNFTEIVKHDDDVHNKKFAEALLAKKIFKKSFVNKELRMLFWDLIGHPDETFKSQLIRKKPQVKKGILSYYPNSGMVEYNEGTKQLTIQSGKEQFISLNLEQVNNLKSFLNQLK